MPDNITQIPAPRVAIWDTVTNYVTRGWYRYFYNLYAILGSGSLRSGAFYDTTTQTAAAINTAYAITLDNTSLTQGVSIGTPTSRVYVDRTGSYNIQFSLQLVSTNAASKDVYIWADVNGTSVPESATKLTMSGSSNAYVAAWNFVIRMSAGDYFRLMWSTSNTNVQIARIAASAPVPAIPSVILTVASNIGE
ncbi:hypothetical protein UFOVP86_16 [uncultured Caudovirales phage]|uniref:Uncharacterized protein n=1 Tax=uncultured Caudovirales phage TaxID=2100421 RepID=A0A6J5TC59_9CAUD|nr:hypothetical protein UFOVP86_16 [uncultured Caudovirales phage]